MKRKIALFLIMACMLTSCGYSGYEPVKNPYLEESKTTDSKLSNNETTIEEKEETINIYDKEILFMDIPYGTSFTKVNEMHGELGLWALTGDSYKTFSTDEILLGDYKGIDFEYGDINIIGACLNGEIDVAGYKTKETQLYFAYNIVDGKLPKTEDESSIYGAKYVFSTEDLEGMHIDLKNKLTSLYGEPSKTTNETDIFKIEYTYTWWYGQNDTVLVLKTQDTKNDTTDLYDDEITISYSWLNGDVLLQQANDLLKQQEKEKEQSNYGSNNTTGL